MNDPLNISTNDLAMMRLLDKIVVMPDGCWHWQGNLKARGYGYFAIHRKFVRSAHRVVYSTLAGPIPEGLELDHLCRVRHCVNPSHLEPVTRQENSLRSPITGPGINARKTHCKNGHEFTDENTYLSIQGRRRMRSCRACHAAYERRRRQAATAA